MELLEAALARDLGAFDAFMQRYERLVYRVAIHFVRDPEAAFDVSQSVFLKAFQGLARFRHEANPRTWLLRITYNESIDCLRRNRLRAVPQDLLGEEAEPLAVEAAQEREALRLDDQARVARAMAGLNQRHRLAVALRYFQGLGIQEIAQVLGCSEGVTKNILFRSLRSLRATLTGTA
jgi:RNA polymerase sigma-70 factor (ECF subfamily)